MGGEDVCKERNFNLHNMFLSLFQCPLDIRRSLSENLVLIGGTPMLTGFRQRLMAELRDLMTRPKYQKVLSLKEFKIHNPPAQSNCVAWLGGE